MARKKKGVIVLDEAAIDRIGAALEAADAPATPKLGIAVKLGTLSVQQETVALPVRFERAAFDLADADALFTGARLNVHLRQGDDPAQSGLFPDEIESVADVHGLSIGTANIGMRLTFRRQDVDLDAAVKLAGLSAVLIARRIGDSADEREIKTEDKGPPIEGTPSMFAPRPTASVEHARASGE